jgi:hypothetical protein
MSVDDHGLEALRKSAHEVTQGNKAEYYILTKIVDALVGSFTPSGLQNGGSIVEVEVNDATWTELSGPLFSTRNAINIQNKSSTNPNGSSPRGTSDNMPFKILRFMLSLRVGHLRSL